MNNMMKLTIAMLVCMAALIGPSVAADIEIDSCEGFGMIPLAAGETVQEGEYSNGPSFYLSENGMVQYLDGPVEEPSYTSLDYVTYTNGAPQFKTVWITLLPCEVEVPACEYRFTDWDDNIQIQPPEVNKSVRVSWSVPDSNGDWSGKVYENGVLNRGPWKGNFPIEVVYTEYEMDSWPPVPTGRVIIDGICEA